MPLKCWTSPGSPCVHSISSSHEWHLNFVVRDHNRAISTSVSYTPVTIDVSITPSADRPPLPLLSTLAVRRSTAASATFVITSSLLTVKNELVTQQLARWCCSSASSTVGVRWILTLAFYIRKSGNERASTQLTTTLNSYDFIVAYWYSASVFIRAGRNCCRLSGLNSIFHCFIHSEQTKSFFGMPVKTY